MSQVRGPAAVRRLDRAAGGCCWRERWCQMCMWCCWTSRLEQSDADDADALLRRLLDPDDVLLTARHTVVVATHRPLEDLCCATLTLVPYRQIVLQFSTASEQLAHSLD